MTLYPYQEDMNQWYENIDILLHPGLKESFCYAVAEAMAKGIYPVVNEFYGSKEIWTGEVDLYQTHQEAINYIQRYRGWPPDLNKRKFIESNYPNQKMFEEIDKLL